MQKQNKKKIIICRYGHQIEYGRSQCHEITLAVYAKCKVKLICGQNNLYLIEWKMFIIYFERQNDIITDTADVRIHDENCRNHVFTFSCCSQHFTFRKNDFQLLFMLLPLLLLLLRRLTMRCDGLLSISRILSYSFISNFYIFKEKIIHNFRVLFSYMYVVTL